MELVVLFGLVVPMLFGPRRSGRMPSGIEMAIGALILAWLLAVYALGSIWNATFGTIAQP